MNSENAKQASAPPRADSSRSAERQPATPRRARGTGNAALEPKRGAAAEWARSLGGGIIIFLVIRTFLLQTFAITSGSMEHTLLVGDFLLLSKSAYGATIPGTQVRTPGYSEPRRGDVIVFRGHHEPLDLVKRLVGMPGDTLSMIAGVLHLNGRPLAEPYAERNHPESDGWHPAMDWQNAHVLASGEERSRPTRDSWGPLVVPGEHYFVLGDNRDDSLDSRYYGFVSHPQVKGRVVGLYFSYDRAAEAKVPVLGRVRWDRVGDRLR